MDRLRQDVHYALRFLTRSPAFTAVVLLTLALGIGMNTAVFSVLYGALYRPLPYADPESLVQVGRTHPNFPGTLLPTSPATFTDLSERLRSVISPAVETPRRLVISERGDAVSQPGSAVSGRFFELLGVPPTLGRTFGPEEDRAGAEPVVVLSDGVWREQFGADPGVIGRSIRLNDTPHTVLGVMPPDFRFSGAALWVPLAWNDSVRAIRGNNFLRMYARLAPGVTVAAATREIEQAWAPIREEFPLGNEQTNMGAAELRELIARRSRTPLFILAGAAGFVLLIACANVANLMLVRAEHRQREVGVRSALGAARPRLIRQFLTESLLCGLLGGVAGVFVALAAVRVLLATFESAIPRAADIGVHAPVLVFTTLVAVVTGLLVGIVPALRSRPDFDALREGSRGGSARTTRFGRALVVAEIALALMLITGAGLLLKSYARATSSDLGFSADEIVAANLWFPASRYTSNAEFAAFFEQLVPRLEAAPGVKDVAMASMVPIREFGQNVTEVSVVGRSEPKASFVELRYVTPDYFQAMGLRLLRGRESTDVEARDRAPVVHINRTLAQQLFGDEDPLAERLNVWPGYEPEIIGVVDDVRDFGPDQLPRPTLYGPTALASNLMVRTTRGAGETASLLRAAARELDPEVAVIRVESMDEIIGRSLATRRFQLALIGTFALTALLLSCVGIYGVLSYSVARQAREIGVRMALGARAGAVARQIAFRGATLAVLGIALGILGALLLRRVIASQLFQVESFDPLVYLAVSAVLFIVAGLASYLPARRAALVQPIQALRAE